MKKRVKPVYHNNLRDSRETLQITIEQLAEHCDVTTETIEKIEDGSYTPSVVLAMRIAEFLSRPVTELFPMPEAVPLTSAMDEERIGREVGRISYNVFLWVALTALFAAFTLQFFPGTDAVAYTLFGV
jgi:putative transcriptional regulator